MWTVAWRVDVCGRIWRDSERDEEASCPFQKVCQGQGEAWCSWPRPDGSPWWLWPSAPVRRGVMGSLLPG